MRVTATVAACSTLKTWRTSVAGPSHFPYRKKITTVTIPWTLPYISHSLRRISRPKGFLISIVWRCSREGLLVRLVSISSGEGRKIARRNAVDRTSKCSRRKSNIWSRRTWMRGFRNQRLLLLARTTVWLLSIISRIQISSFPPSSRS